MTIVEALVAHHDVLRRLYAQAETNPEVFEDFYQTPGHPSHHGGKIFL